MEAPGAITDGEGDRRRRPAAAAYICCRRGHARRLRPTGSGEIPRRLRGPAELVRASAGRSAGTARRPVYRDVRLGRAGAAVAVPVLAASRPDLHALF